MSFPVRDTGGEEIEPLSQKMHHAVTYMLVDIGTQINQTFQTASKELVIGWEVPSERYIWKDKDTGEETERAKVITRRFTASLARSSHLKAILETWRGQPFTPEELQEFDLSTILGINCYIQVMHKTVKRTGGIFPEVSAVMPLPPGTATLKPERNIIQFHMSVDKVIPDNVPNWIKKRILASPEWAQLSGAAAPPGQQPGPVGSPPPGFDAPPQYDIPPPGDDDIPF